MMGLNDFFRKGRTPSISPEERLWAGVQTLCGQHIDRMVALFRSRGWPRMDWAEPRLRALARPDMLNDVIIQARQALHDFRFTGSIAVRSAGVVDSWLIMVSSFPSASDSEFLKACPKASYADFAHAVRRVFRSNTEGWDRLDFAHWILLVDERVGDVAVHAHTVWNYQSQISWACEGLREKKLIPAPVIVPEELFLEHSRIREMADQMLREDILFDQQQSDKSHKR